MSPLYYIKYVRERKEGCQEMWTVDYKYYNYPYLTKTFESHAAAKKFFWYIGKKKGVTRTQIKGVSE